MLSHSSCKSINLYIMSTKLTEINSKYFYCYWNSMQFLNSWLSEQQGQVPPVHQIQFNQTNVLDWSTEDTHSIATCKVSCMQVNGRVRYIWADGYKQTIKRLYTWIKSQVHVNLTGRPACADGNDELHITTPCLDVWETLMPKYWIWIRRHVKWHDGN